MSTTRPALSQSEGTGLLAGNHTGSFHGPWPSAHMATREEGASVLSRTASCAHSAQLPLEQQQSQALLAATAHPLLEIPFGLPIKTVSKSHLVHMVTRVCLT